MKHYLTKAIVCLLTMLPFYEIVAKDMTRTSISIIANLTDNPDSLFDGSLFQIDNYMLLMEYPDVAVKDNSRPIHREAYTHTQQLRYTPKNSSCHDYLIIAAQVIYDSLSFEIKRYSEDVHTIYGYGIIVESTKNASPEQLKALIQSYQSNLGGVFFIGNLGEAMFETDNDHNEHEYRKWPCDLFFMDLNGTWIDSDGNGYYDQHSGNAAPEIFFGRLSTEGLSALGNEVELIRRQLQKSHGFWWKTSYHSSNTVLNYIDNDWTDIFPPNEIAPAFSTYNVDDFRYGNTALFSSTDYLFRITYYNYGFTHLAAHSSPTRHVIAGDYLYASTISGINSSNYAYNLFCCSACNWKASSTRYLGGAYLFNNGKTLDVVGSTKTGGMLGTQQFYSQFPTKHIGGALLSWWQTHHGNSHSSNTIWWSYGMTLLGDPTINFRHQVSDYCNQNLVLTSFPLNDNSILVLMKAGSTISTSQNFIIPQGVEVILDAPEVTISPTFYCPLGSTLELRTEGCEL